MIEAEESSLALALPDEPRERAPAPPSAPSRAAREDGDANSTALSRFRELVGGAISQSMLISFAVFACWAIQGVLLARLLGPEGRGEYQTATLFTQALLFAGLLGSQQAVTRRAAWLSAQGAEGSDESPDALAGHLAALRRTSLRLAVCTGLGTAAVVSILALTLPSEKLHLVPLCIAGSLYLVGEHLRLALLSVDQGAAAWRRFNISRIVAAACLPLILLALMASGVRNVAWAVGGSVLAPLVGLGVHLWMIGPRNLALADLGTSISVGELFHDGLPQALSIAVGTLYGKLDSALMMFMADPHDQGLYAAAVSAVVVLTIAPTTLGVFSFNAGADPERRLAPGQVVKNAALVFALQLLSAVCFAAILAPAVLLVYGEKFQHAVPFALVLIPAHAICGCGLVVEGYLRGRGKPRSTMTGALSGALVMLAGTWLLRDRWGEMAVPMAVIGGHATTCLVMFGALWTLVHADRAEAPA